ncbi:hypothetical protein ACEQ8H_008277 [Pleosporales sp. CAS-2024a]
MAATVSADSTTRNAVSLKQSFNAAQPYARIINRCSYPVYLWSVFRGEGCPVSQMVTLNTGEIYAENYAMAQDTAAGRNGQGVSIKISKAPQCKPNDITQLEYFMDNRDTTPKGYQMNYLDVSYVDCLGNNCPTRNEGYYLQVGTPSVRALRKTTDNSWCPILSCHDAASCALMSYVLPDDIQTKTCDLVSSMDFYLCGSQAPGPDDNNPAPLPNLPAPSPQKPAPPAPQSSSPSPAASTPVSLLKVHAAALPQTPPPSSPSPTPAPSPTSSSPTPKVKTVYVTAYEYINARKRAEQAHRHARHHQPLNA